MEAMVAASVVELADADEAAVQRWLAERGRELAKGEAAAAVAEVEEGWGGGGLRSGRHVNALLGARAPSWRGWGDREQQRRPQKIGSGKTQGK